jgi:hypothetical protein
VNQLGAGRRGMRSQIVLLAKEHGQPAPGCVARDARAVDPAAHDEQIVPILLSHLRFLFMALPTARAADPALDNTRYEPEMFECEI